MQQLRTPLKDLAKLFFKLGIIGFGGPAVHISMMNEEVVKKRQWLSEQEFLDLIGTTNLIPGPNSTEMTMHIGHIRAGWKGLIVAGFCFITPAVAITMLLAWLYQMYGSLPQVEPFIYGIVPAVIAVVIELMIILGRKTMKNTILVLISVIAAALALLNINELIILFGAGAAGVLIQLAARPKQSLHSILPLAAIQAAFWASDSRNWKIFLMFLKIGAIIYGSGYVLYAFFDAEFVKTGMLTKQQLVDAIAVGQFTPGPVFSSATFVGWQMGGFYGSLLASLGIFLPPFLFVAFLNPLLPKLKRSPLFKTFLDTVNAVSIALVLAVCVDMAKTSFNGWRPILICALCLAAAFWFKKLNKAFIITGGALLGYLLTLV